MVKVYLGQMSTGVSFLGSEVTGSEFTWVEDLLGSEFGGVRVGLLGSVCLGQSFLGIEFTWVRGLLGSVCLGERTLGQSLLGLEIY